MRVLVCGGRDYGLDELGKPIKEVFNKGIDIIKAQSPTFIITGGAKGADQIGFEASLAIRCGYKGFPAKWKAYGKKAGPIRNQQMLDEGKPDLVVAFPGGSGTKDMVTRAQKAGIKVINVEQET